MRAPAALLSFAALAGLCLAARAETNPSAALVKDFEDRIAAYMKLRDKAARDLPRLKPTPNASKISRHERELADRIRQERPSAAQGDIFTPEIGAEFRRLIRATMEGPEGARIKSSLNHAEPVAITLRVGDAYPHDVPLQSTPPSLLLNLPKLPRDLGYRIVGRALVLRDSRANLVVDFLPAALP